MTEEKTKTEKESLPNSHLKEQDEGIIEVFASADHRVLTNTEISEQVSLSSRQVRRRLDKLADQGIIGKRVVSGVKLAWLEKDVKEPITVQYPLLRYVRDRASVQLFLIGVAAGIIAVLVLLGAAISIGYDVPLPYVSRQQLLIYGVLAATGSAAFILVGGLFALVGRLLRYFGVDIESRINSMRE